MAAIIKGDLELPQLEVEYRVMLV
jgi:hypothetical protein